jgi:chromosome segregation ATPase
MAESTKEKKVPLVKQESMDAEVTAEQLQGQLNYAQKIINVLQGKLNDANGKLVQMEAQLQIANEDRENILKQVEPLGITPQ